MIVNLNDEAYNLKAQLGGEEHIIWVGTAGRGIVFRTIDWFMIPFSLLWGGFAIVWEFIAITAGAPLFFALFGLPFVLVGLFLIVGRFAWDARRRKHTLYALTNKRLISRTGVKTHNISSLNLSEVKNVGLSLKPDGRGTITLYNYTLGVNVSKALSGFQIFGGGSPNTLELIDDAQEVYNKINETLNKPGA